MARVRVQPSSGGNTGALRASTSQGPPRRSSPSKPPPVTPAEVGKKVTARKAATRRARMSAYLKALRILGRTTFASGQVGIPRQTIQNWRYLHPKFKEAEDQALAEWRDGLEVEACRRATRGVRSYKFHQGNPLYVRCADDDPDRDHEVTHGDGTTYWVKHYYELKFSDVLLSQLLNGNISERYHYYGKIEHSGRVDTNVTLEEKIERLPGPVRDRLRKTLGGVSDN